MQHRTISHRQDLSKAAYGSDLIVDMMRAFDIEYIALNSGASFRWLHDSILNYGGNTTPEVIMCLHEETAVALAHGYAKAKGKPMAAVVHNVVGLQHASMAIYNAWCDRAPMMVLGGTGPMDLTTRRHWDWMHTALVQGNIVRDFVKWDDQPHVASNIHESFIRGFRIATTEPKGPVYICYDGNVQAERLESSVELPDISRYAPPTPPQADALTLERAAKWLIEAENPVIVADHLSDSADACRALVELAELLVIPVLDKFGRYNFPSDHSMNLTGAEEEILSQADLVMGLEVKDLFDALNIQSQQTQLFDSTVPSEARIIHMSLWEKRIDSWATTNYRLPRVDLNIPADPGVALPQLVRVCRQLLPEDKTFKERRKIRFARMEEKHKSLRDQWREQAKKTQTETPVSLATLAQEVWNAVKDYDWALVNGDLDGWVRRIWDFSKPAQFLGSSGGGGLGYGIGASIGAALAYKDTDTLCVDIQTDGDLMYADGAL